ncbi:FecCD family ABC transporter permease [Carnimonas bestiolae]|uniref:FecCD family ABC transporter permease n=1 Tax=Carnimonas bestiolae TaxID=3402172 RepID=UPI003EDBC1A0
MSSPASTIAGSYRRFTRHRRLTLLLLIGLLGAALLLDIAVGPAMLAPSEVLEALVGHGAADSLTRLIVWDLRLPMALMAVLAGSALGLAGAEMQTVLDNPLASPFTLGVGAAAALGASLAIVFNMSLWWLSGGYMTALAGFVCALAAMWLIDLMTLWQGVQRDRIVLFGISLNFVFNALHALVQLVASPDALQQLLFWSMGSLHQSSWQRDAIVLAVLVICLPLSLRHAWMLTVLRSGEDHARSLGLPVARVRRLALLRVSLLSAVAVSFIGVIGFIGLIAPHMARLLVGEDHRFYLPASALTGGVLLALADVLSKTLVHGMVLPLGIVTSLVGIPVFLVLLFSTGRPQ